MFTVLAFIPVCRQPPLDPTRVDFILNRQDDLNLDTVEKPLHKPASGIGSFAIVKTFCYYAQTICDMTSSIMG